MAKKGARETIRMRSEGVDENGVKSTEVVWTVKNKKNTVGRLELKKYDKSLQKHCLFKEAK